MPRPREGSKEERKTPRRNAVLLASARRWSGAGCDWKFRWMTGSSSCGAPTPSWSRAKKGTARDELPLDQRRRLLARFESLTFACSSPRRCCTTRAV
eukprot:scaffold8550_cov267-Pinguiococcus_pyrenoidosus.AAC.3